MTRLSVERMASHLTAPFARGADLLELAFAGGSSPTLADVVAYDFREHVARFDRDPQPRYVVHLRRDAPAGLQLTFDFDAGTPAVPLTSIPLSIPAGSLKFDSFVIDLSTTDGRSHDGPDAFLRTIHVAPALPDGVAADWFRVTALLGNMAKLFWVLSCERSHLRRQLEQTVDQRRLPTASRFSLDLLGNDLGVPRFPPLPYSPDDSTVALYHMDEPPGALTVLDILVKHGGVGHEGTNDGGHAVAGEPGRFASGFAFRHPDASISIPAHADFDLTADDSFTADLFLNPETGLDPVGHIIARHADPADPTKPGWAISLGEFGRGLAGNLRFLVSDGTSTVEIFADRPLEADRFHHVAGVIDRDSQQARLFLDGELVSSASIASIGIPTGPDDVVIGGFPGARFRGAIDEARLSRAARSDFHPALGEGDEPYRKRLRLFERWTLPTPEALRRLINEAAGPVGGDDAPLVLDDANVPLLIGSAAVRIFPSSLATGESIAASGDRHAREADASGSLRDEPAPDPSFLVVHDDPRATYAASPPGRPGLPAASTHSMRPVTAEKLNGLLGLLASPDPLEILSAFDPRADDLRALGRSLVIRHPSIAPGSLAALASRAGFDFVSLRRDGTVSASTAPGDDLAIVLDGAAPSKLGDSILVVGDALPLKAEPSLPVDTLFHWLTIRSGPGRATISPRDSLPAITLNASAPGVVYLKVEARRGQSSASGSRSFRIIPASLPAGATIGGDGALNVAPEIAGKPDPAFDPAYLVTHDSPEVDYGADINNRRMQPSVARRLDLLLGFLDATGAAGPLGVLKAYVSGSSGLDGVGRSLVLSHPALAGPKLAALAHAAGFSYVESQADGNVLVLQSAESFLTVSAPEEMVEGDTSPVSVRPGAAPSAVAVSAPRVFVANEGTDVVSEIDPANGNVVGPTIKVGWGPKAIALSPDGARLYTADSSSSTVTAVDLASRQVVGTIKVPKGPRAIAHHPTLPKLFVGCAGSPRVAEIDSQALTVTRTATVAVAPNSLAVSPDGLTVWVALDQPNNAILVLDSGDVTQPGTGVEIGGAARGVAFSPDGSLAFATAENGRFVRLKTTPPGLDSSVDIGGLPGAVAVSTDGLTVAVADLAPRNFRVMLLEPDGSIKAVVRIPSEPSGVATLPGAGPGRVYVTGRGSGTVTVIDVAEQGVADTWPLGSGRGERLSWVVEPLVSARAIIAGSVSTETTLRAVAAGPILLRAVFSPGGGRAPYTFDVRLNPALEASTAVLRKDQYDRVMNVLNAFHPLGVEVSTRSLRDRVVEIRDGLLDAFPGYTFPNFRSRGSIPRPPSQE